MKTDSNIVPVRPVTRSPPPGLALVEEGSLRMAPILGVPRLLEEMGVDPYSLVVEAGIDSAFFDNPENVIPFADVGRFLALCSARTRCPHFGLLVGQNAGLDVLGLLGQLALHSPDIGTALRNTILYLHLHDRGAIPSLSVSDGRAMLAYTIYQPDVPGTDQIYDGAMAITYNVVKALAGPGWTAREVLLYRPRPADTEPYRHFYQVPLSFGAEHQAVVFDAAWLDCPLEGANALVHRQIMQEIESLEIQGAGDLATQLRRILRRLLVCGATQGETCLQQVAELFEIHQRTLNRRLRSQGTSFKVLIEETRYEIARQLLRDTHLPVTEIAAALDYSQTSAFDRAFRRWSGTAPAVWRSENTQV